MMIKRRLVFKKRNILLVCLLILGYFFLKPSPKAQVYSSPVIRGVWLTNVFTAFLHHTTLLDNLFYHLAKSGYTHVYISAYGYGGTLYKSNHSSSNPLFVPPFTNVLKASENEAQRQGLKLYAWLEYGLMLMKNDEVVIQIYRDNSEEFVKSILTSKIDRLPQNMPVAIGIFAGPLDKPKDFGEVNKQIKLATDLGYGFSIFCWEYRALGGL